MRTGCKNTDKVGEVAVWGGQEVTFLSSKNNILVVIIRSEMQIYTCKSKPIVLSQKKVGCSLQVRGETLLLLEEFKYHGMVFKTIGKKGHENDKNDYEDAPCSAPARAVFFFCLIICEDVHLWASFPALVSMFHVTLLQFTNHSGTFLLPLHLSLHLKMLC